MKYGSSTEEDKEIGPYSQNFTGAKTTHGQSGFNPQSDKLLTRGRKESTLDIEDLIITRHPLKEFGSTQEEFRSGTAGRCVWPPTIRKELQTLRVSLYTSFVYTV